MSVSGIDTKSIIDQLMAIERIPQDQMRSRLASLQKTQDAWSGIMSKLTALKTAADKIAPANAFAGAVTAKSSADTVVSTRVIGTPAAGQTVTIRPTVTAKAHSVRTNTSYTGATQAITGSLAITQNSVTTNFTSADGTIGGMVDAVNAANLGYSAQLLEITPGSFQVVLTSKTTGSASNFTAVQTGGWTSAFTTAVTGVNASVIVNGVTVTRASNTITDIVPGVELNILNTSTANLTITTARDNTKVVEGVKALVDAANSVLNTIKTATATSETATGRGPLSGNFQARTIAQQVRAEIAKSLGSFAGTELNSDTLGLSLTRDGAITFDSAKLESNLASNYDAVIAALGRTATSTALGVTATASSGATYGVNNMVVTQAASYSTLTGTAFTKPGTGTAINMTINTASTGPVAVSFAVGSTWANTATAMNSALSAAGLSMRASVRPGNNGLVLTETRYGSANTFNIVSGALGLSGAAVLGADAAGTLNGTAFVASGQSLTSGGVTYLIKTTAANLASSGGTVTGDVSVSEGLASALARIGGQGGSSGSITAAKNAVGDRMRELNTRISNFDNTLAARKNRLIRQFSAMESLLATMSSSSAFLSQLSVQQSQ